MSSFRPMVDTRAATEPRGGLGRLFVRTQIGRDVSHLEVAECTTVPTWFVSNRPSSTRDRDQTLKARRYAELGIPHYWIVDPEALRIAFYRAEGTSYVVAADAEGDTTVEAPGWPGLTIAIGELWKPSPLERADGA